MAKQRDHGRLEQRRLRAAELFENGWPAAEVARRLGVARQAAYRWQENWRAGGVDALASKGPAGRKPRLGPEQTQRLVAALLEGPSAHGYKTQLWTLPRVAGLIEELTGVRYHPGHVWRVMGALGFSCQRPERRAIERDEAAIQHWKRVEWPALKKKRVGRAA
jgi:transposase